MTMMKKIKLKNQPGVLFHQRKKLETGILLEVWSCVMERFHKDQSGSAGQQNNFE